MRNRTQSELGGMKEARVCFCFSVFRYPGLLSVVLGDLALLHELFRRSSFQRLRSWDAVGVGGKKGTKKDGGGIVGG